MPQLPTRLLPLLIAVPILVCSCSSEEIQYKYKEVYSFQRMGKDTALVEINARLDSLGKAIKGRFLEDSAKKNSLARNLIVNAMDEALDAVKSLRNEYELMKNGEGYMTIRMEGNMMTSQRIVWQIEGDSLFIRLNKELHKSFFEQNGKWSRTENVGNVIKTTTLEVME